MNRVSVSVLLLGFALFISGAACVYRPAGLLVAGAGLMASVLMRKTVKK